MLTQVKSLAAAALYAAWPRLELPLEFRYQQWRGRLEEEMDLIESLSRRDGLAIDIGANLGFYSLRLSRCNRQVEAFEPNPACLKPLRAYRGHNIRIHPMALSSRSATATLNVPRDKGLHGFGSLNRLDALEADAVPVSTARLDDFAFTGVSLVKIDVEGHEREVIRGARETLLRERPNLLVEIEQRHLPVPIREVFEEIESLGCHGAFWMNRSYHPLSAFSCETHQSEAAMGRPGYKYVNNFVFRFGMEPSRR